jgi:hypothetical protein
VTVAGLRRGEISELVPRNAPSRGDDDLGRIGIPVRPGVICVNEVGVDACSGPETKAAHAERVISSMAHPPSNATVWQRPVSASDQAFIYVDESMVTALLARGLPPEAIREDRTLDLDVLREHGWWVEGPLIYGPPRAATIVGCGGWWRPGSSSDGHRSRSPGGCR